MVKLTASEKEVYRNTLQKIMEEQGLSAYYLAARMDVEYNTFANLLKVPGREWAGKTIRKLKALIKKYGKDLNGSC